MRPTNHKQSIATEAEVEDAGSTCAFELQEQFGATSVYGGTSGNKTTPGIKVERGRDAIGKACDAPSINAVSTAASKQACTEAMHDHLPVKTCVDTHRRDGGINVGHDISNSLLFIAERVLGWPRICITSVLRDEMSSELYGCITFEDAPGDALDFRVGRGP